MSHSHERADRFTLLRMVSVDGGLLGRLTVGRGSERVFQSVSNRIRIGAMLVRTPDGTEHRLGGAQPGPEAVIHINSWRMLRRFILGGALGFSHSYLDGDWDSPAPEKVLEVGALNRSTFQPSMRGRSIMRALNHLPHLFRANTKAGSRRNIAFHYDLGNDFYAAWLDPSMTYSAALFDHADEELETAQLRKYRRLMDQLDLKPGEQVLEIGCGWGGFAELAARERGVHVTGITLSREQLDYAQQRIQAAGLSDRVRFELRDYRDIEGQYDKIVSIEMIEAVGERFWPSYFQTLRRALKAGGRAALQAITIDPALFADYRRKADFIQTYIFPGGMLPTRDALVDHADKVGLAFKDEHCFGADYGETLRRWRLAFDQALDEGHLESTIDERFRRLWRYYLCYCEGGFRAGSIDVGQYCFQG